ncbi:hypothetical protein BASA81_017904 [Batrachochytrium salamandrivorans]|nr:hypothetical protein BASA81_017904 [Batrachochytrium salamandrivorans]
MHDITYQYGFTEKAGNFQKDNFGKGGEDGDAVAVTVLNSFRSQMKAGGMGEGWSDMMALFVLAKKSDTATTSIPMVYWSLVTKHGFSSNLHDASQSAGNIVAMQNIIGGLMIQSCNPTFLGARDAIVAADASYYKGANKCEILKAFAKRGLGSKATDTRKNDFSVPSECDGDAPSPDPTTTTTRRSRTTTTKISRTTTKKARTTSRAPEPTDEPDDEPTDESDDDPTFELDEFAEM